MARSDRGKRKGQAQDVRRYLDVESSRSTKRRKSYEESSIESGDEDDEEDDEEDIESDNVSSGDDDDRTLVARGGQPSESEQEEEDEDEVEEVEEVEEVDEDEDEDEDDDEYEDEDEDDEDEDDDDEDEYVPPSKKTVKAALRKAATGKAATRAAGKGSYDGEERETNDDGSTRLRRGRHKGDDMISFNSWRPLAEEELELLTARGGILWQAARPLLMEMNERERKKATEMLKGLMASLNTKFKATLVPGTRPMPREKESAIILTNVKSHPQMSSLMSWSVDTGGVLQENEDVRRVGRRTGSSSSRVLADEDLTGYDKDNALLEALLMPEINELVSLMHASKQQDTDLQETRNELRKLRSQHEEMERLAEEADENIRAILGETMDKLHSMYPERIMTASHDQALRDSAIQFLDKVE